MERDCTAHSHKLLRIYVGSTDQSYTNVTDFSSDYVTECTMCVQGHDPLTFSFLSLLFFDWVEILWPPII